MRDLFILSYVVFSRWSRRTCLYGSPLLSFFFYTSTTRVFSPGWIPPCCSSFPLSPSLNNNHAESKRSFKNHRTRSQTHLSGGNHHNLLEIVKCHFVATRWGPLTALGKEGSRYFRSNRKRRFFFYYWFKGGLCITATLRIRVWMNCTKI